MSAPLPFTSPNCCAPTCADSPQAQVPGPKGDKGDAGDNGTDGRDSFTTTTFGFTVPLVGSTVAIQTDDSAFMVVGEPVFIGGGAGTYQVTDTSSFNQPIVKNLGYTGNAAPGTPIANGVTITPTGFVGPAGPSGVGTLNSISPTTTKGDLIVDNGATSPVASDVRHGVGANGSRLVADSTQADGWRNDKVDLSLSIEVKNALAIANGGTGATTQQAALNALANLAGAADGDILTRAGGNWSLLHKGTSLQLLRMNSGGTALEYVTALILPPNIQWPGTAPGTTGSITLDCGTGQTFNISSTGNITIAAFSNFADGQNIQVWLTMNGADALSFTPPIKWAGGIPAVPSGGGVTDIFWFAKSGTTIYGAAKLHFS